MSFFSRETMWNGAGGRRKEKPLVAVAVAGNICARRGRGVRPSAKVVHLRFQFRIHVDTTDEDCVFPYTHTHTHTISLKQRLITRRFRRRLFHFYDSWQYFQKGTSAIHAFLIGLLFQISWNLHDLEFLQISRWKEHFLKSIFKIRSPRRNWITQLK